VFKRHKTAVPRLSSLKVPVNSLLGISVAVKSLYLWSDQSRRFVYSWLEV
jgi:hypothetical protein